MDHFQQSATSDDDFEVEVSALDSADEADTPFAAQVPPEPAHQSRARNKRLIVGGCALLAALLALASVPALRSQALGLFSSLASPTPAGGWFSYAPLTPTSLKPGPGWTQAGPRDALAIVFAPGAPETGYTCGPERPPGNQPVPLIVGVTRDAGKSWQTLGTPASGVICNVTVDPTNALDVVLLASSCADCSQPETSALYRSFDGGLHWSLWPLPPLGPLPTTLSETQWVWVGSTLMLAPRLMEDNGYEMLAASVAGRPFVWLNMTYLYAGAPAATIGDLLATSATLYVGLGSPDCPTGCYWVQSRDDGAAWSPFKPTFHGQTIMLLATGGDGRALLGVVERDAPPDSYTYLRSTDGGATWQMLSPRPDLLVAEEMVAAPDGSIYAAFEQDPNNPTGQQGSQAALGIYALAPQGAAWQYVGPMPPGGLFTLGWNAAGHPLALWGLVDPNNLSAGLERRQL